MVHQIQSQGFYCLHLLPATSTLCWNGLNLSRQALLRYKIQSFALKTYWHFVFERIFFCCCVYAKLHCAETAEKRRESERKRWYRETTDDVVLRSKISEHRIKRTTFGIVYVYIHCESQFVITKTAYTYIYSALKSRFISFIHSFAFLLCELFSVL